MRFFFSLFASSLVSRKESLTLKAWNNVDGWKWWKCWTQLTSSRVLRHKIYCLFIITFESSFCCLQFQREKSKVTWGWKWSWSNIITIIIKLSWKKFSTFNMLYLSLDSHPNQCHEIGSLLLINFVFHWITILPIFCFSIFSVLNSVMSLGKELLHWTKQKRKTLTSLMMDSRSFEFPFKINIFIVFVFHFSIWPIFSIMLIVAPGNFMKLFQVEH